MESPAQEQVHGRVGRPRKFETHEVLTAALRVFLTRGYIGASVTELTAAMGIARPSLYRFFGNKEGLFKRALELHSEHHLAYLRTAIGAPTAREVVERLLRRALADKDPCNGVEGFIGFFSALPDDDEVGEPRKIIAEHHGFAIALLSARFEKARLAGELPPEARAGALACYLESLIHGVSVQGRNGSPRADLEELIETAISAFQRTG